MRKRLAVAALILVVPFTVGAQPNATPAGRARDAVIVDPTHHQVVLENDHVRVIRALVSPGARSPMHTHPPAVLVSLGTSRSRGTVPNGTSSTFDLLPGQVIWLDGAEHSWQMLAGQLHVVAVEIKAAARGAVPAPVTLPSTDAVKADPVVHQVLLDNPYVRVLEGLAATGSRSPMHSHSHAITLVSMGRVRLNLTPAGGNSLVLDLHPGQVLWLEPGAHSWEVISGIHNAIAVEVKSAAAK